MKDLKVATWNIQTSNFKLENEFKALSVVDLLEKENVDVLALQNVNLKLANRINELLFNNYSDYRLVRDNSNDSKINVNFNAFITLRKDMQVSSYTLNNRAKIHDQRSVEELFLLKSRLEILNSNLISNEKIGKKQLSEFVEFYKNQKELLPSIDYVLMGCLSNNLKCSVLGFLKDRFADLGLKKISLFQNTCDDSLVGRESNYIFIPDEYKINDFAVIKDYTSVSKHYPVVVKIKR